MTTLHVKKNTWKKLNSLKEPGESMNDVIERLLAIRSQELRIGSSLSFVTDGEKFDSLLEEFVEVLSEEVLDQTIELSRRSFSKEAD